MRLLAAILVAIALSLVPAAAATYYVATTGSDSTGAGTIGNPWASCAHNVNSGDQILYQDGTYNLSGTNFLGSVNGTGRATCAAQNFGGAIINSSESHGAFWVWKSNWAISGFTLSSSGGACIDVQPIQAGVVKNILMENFVCTGAMTGCVGLTPHVASGSSSDYLTIRNFICYNSAQSIGAVYNSAIDLFCPQNADSKTGTHIYTGGGLIYGNTNTNAITPHSDGNGILIDRTDGSTCGIVYSGTILNDSNIFFANGGPAIKAFLSPVARIVNQNNLIWADLTDPYYGDSNVAEIRIENSNNVLTTNNFVQTGTGVCCSSATPAVINGYYDSADGAGTVANAENNNSFYAFNSHTCTVAGGSCDATDTLVSPPAVTAPQNPGIPSCTGYASARACIAGIMSGVPRPMTVLH